VSLAFTPSATLKDWSINSALTRRPSATASRTRTRWSRSTTCAKTRTARSQPMSQRLVREPGRTALPVTALPRCPSPVPITAHPQPQMAGRVTF